jgi:two-component system OmpR family sensor kinase
VGTEGDAAPPVLEVCDEGPGMNPEDAQRVFERFYRATTSRTRTSGRVGLGSVDRRSLVLAHGGTVGVDTAPGRGCRFRVTLPRLVEWQVSPAEPAPP